MKKIFKMIIAGITVLIVLGVVFFSLLVMDVAGNLATSSQSLPNGAATQRALVVYDPGLSGGAKDAATKIGIDLQDAGYDVVLAGVKSSAASDFSGFSVIVVGGPIYFGKPAASIQTYLNSFAPPASARVGVFGYGSMELNNTDSAAVLDEISPLPIGSTLTFDAAVKVNSDGNVTSICQEFVNKLVLIRQ